MARMRFVRELQRRRVFRVAAAYAVVGWLLVQVATQVFPFFELPNWSVRLIVLVVLAGFPIALVLAWAFDATPQGIVRTDAGTPVRGARRGAVFVGLVGVLVAAAAGFGYWRWHAPGPAERSSAATSAPTAQAPVNDKSIAVLPFENLSAEKENEYFASGMQDEILTRLAGIRELKVISRTSTKRYESRPDNLKTVAAELGVAHILEGSVQRSGDAVRVNVQLIDARSDTHLWAQTFDRELKNAFVVESEVAQQIADVLKVQLSPRESQALAMTTTQNSAAYDHFLRAEFLLRRAWDTFEDADYGGSSREFEQAIKLDPDFALAYARRAYDQLGRHWQNRRLSNAEMEEVKGWIDRALKLAPDLPAAHAALGYYHYWGFRHYDAALAEFDRTLQLAPNSIDALSGIAFIHRRLAQWSEALDSLRRAMELSPRDNLLSSETGTTLLILRQYADAESELRRALDLDPGDTNAKDFLVRTFLFGHGDVTGARKANTPPPPWRIPYHNTLAGDLLDLVNERVYPDLFERRFDEALQQWDSAPRGSPEEQLTERVARVAIKVIANDRQSLQGECAALAPMLAELARKEPDSLSVLQQTSWVELCLGHNAAAIAAARRATEVLPLKADAYFGVYQAEGLAEISARAGAPDEAIRLLGQLLSLPAGESVTLERLRRDPLWDPLRNDPRFQKLIQDGAEKVGP